MEQELQSFLPPGYRIGLHHEEVELKKCTCNCERSRWCLNFQDDESLQTERVAILHS
jgi:hypothetical protein